MASAWQEPDPGEHLVWFRAFDFLGIERDVLNEHGKPSRINLQHGREQGAYASHVMRRLTQIEKLGYLVPDANLDWTSTIRPDGGWFKMNPNVGVVIDA